MEDLVNEKNPPLEDRPVDRDPSLPTREFARGPDGKTIDIDPDTFDPASIDAEPQRTGPTGPRTPAGKAVSSLNRLDHGCCSKIAILPDEDPAEFEFIRNSWFERYPPDEDFAWLIDETVLAYWHYKRASKRLYEIECELPRNANRWTDENHKRFSNFSRYKTTDERRLTRFYKELEAYDNKVLRRNDAKDRLWVAVAKINAEWIRRKEEKMLDEMKIGQLVQVDIVDGKCVTNYYPTNKQLIEKASLLPKLPVLVTRWIQFTKEIPPEYAWTNPLEIQKDFGGEAVQRMAYDRWLQKIEEEKATGTGHIGPFIDFPKPDHPKRN